MNITAVQNVSLFSGLSLESLQSLSLLARQQVYKKGERILDYLHAGQTFLYVLHGWIKLVKESAEGEEIVVDVLTDSQYCGEMFAFQDNLTDRYEAQSLSDAEIMTLPVDGLKKLMLSDHVLSINFLQASLQKQQKLNMSVEHLSIQNAAQRIGCFMLRLCRSYLPRAGKFLLAFPYDKTLLAARLGMRPETFSRALRRLNNECEVDVQGNTIELQNMPKLIEYVCKHCSKVYPCNERE